jgi:hypothetical protein
MEMDLSFWFKNDKNQNVFQISWCEKHHYILPHRWANIQQKNKLGNKKLLFSSKIFHFQTKTNLNKC